MMPILHQIVEEGCFIYLGWCLPTSVWGNQVVPHASTCPYSSGVRNLSWYTYELWIIL